MELTLPTNSSTCSSLSAAPTSPHPLPPTLLPEGGAVQWVRIPARDRWEGSGGGGEGELWHQAEPWEATCHPGFSQPRQRDAPTNATAAQGAGLASSALGRQLDSESWPVPTSSAGSPGCPGKPLFPGTPCSQEETRVSGPRCLAHKTPCFIPTVPVASSPRPAKLSPYAWLETSRCVHRVTPQTSLTGCFFSTCYRKSEIRQRVFYIVSDHGFFLC